MHSLFAPALRTLGIFMYVLVVLIPLLAVWAIRRREYQTFAAAVVGFGGLLVALPGWKIGEARYIMEFRFAFGLASAVVSLPLLAGLFSRRPKDWVTDSLIVIGLFIIADAMLQRILGGFVLAMYVLTFTTFWGQGRAIFLLVRGKKREAAHCIAYSAIALCMNGFLSLAFIGM